MKCVKILKSGAILRTHDIQAAQLVWDGLATYSNKLAWKAEGRIRGELKAHERKEK